MQLGRRIHPAGTHPLCHRVRTLLLPYYRAWRCLAPHGSRSNIRMQARLHAQKAEESVVSRVHRPDCFSSFAPHCQPRPLTSDNACLALVFTRSPPTLFRLVTRNTTETQTAIANTPSGQCGVTMNRMQQACRARDPGQLRKRTSAAAFCPSTLPTHHTTTEDQNPARCLTKFKTCTK